MDGISLTEGSDLSTDNPQAPSPKSSEDVNEVDSPKNSPVDKSGNEDEKDDNSSKEDEDEEDEEEVVTEQKVTKAPKRILEDDDDEEDDDEDDDNDDDTSDDDDNDNGVNEDDVRRSGNKHDAEEEEEAEKRDDEDEDDDDEDEDDEADIQRREIRNDRIYDFDIMMAKKKEENSRKRRRRNYDIINDNDDIIADIITQMKSAVDADSEANREKKAATNKLKLLPFVISQLRKVDLRDAFLDSDVLSVITEWLAPLPDKSLPHLQIRENLIKILIDFNLYDVDRIKSSGIGKAIMYLYKHPKETRENKQRAKQLISCWSRPIFQLDSSFTSISREEREQRDLELMSKQRRVSKQQDSSDGESAGPSSSAKKPREETQAQKPGEKGWIPRARVPAPSMKDYVIRPRSKYDGDIGKSTKRASNMLEKYMKNQQERRRASRQQRAVNMKIDRV